VTGRARAEHVGAIYSSLMQNALNAGSVMVSSAGNQGPDDCTTGWPSIRSETLAVGALEHPLGLDYDDVPMRHSSSTGGMVITTTAGTSAFISVLDLAAPGNFRRWFTPPGNSYGTADAAGTSFSAPVVSAVAGLMRHTFWGLGLGHGHARNMMVNTLLMGNGWSSSSGTIRALGMDWRSGAGRVKAHFPHNLDLVAPWGWGWRAVTIRQGETVTWPIGMTQSESLHYVTQWKWAVLWTPPDLSQVPDVDFYVDETTCPPGGSYIRNGLNDLGYDHRVRFKLGRSSLDGGRCYRMRAYGYNVPAGGVTFYSADYYHSGPAGDH
jgi:hypothetical protein